MSDSQTPWTVARQAPLSMGFSRQEYWSGLPFPSPGSSSPRDRTWVSYITDGFFTIRATKSSTEILYQLYQIPKSPPFLLRYAFLSMRNRNENETELVLEYYWHTYRGASVFSKASRSTSVLRLGLKLFGTTGLRELKSRTQNVLVQL